MPVTSYRVGKILQALNRVYPDVATELRHNNPFELLIATMLSAQCTDRQVNSVTPALFARFADAAQMAQASIKELEKLIYATGFFRSKARNIKKCAQLLMEKYGGEVPASLENLIDLPGVGRKTANVVLGSAFAIPGMVVDTHVKRIARRLGWTCNQNPEKIESDLMRLVAKRHWNRLSLQFIHLGRAICIARQPSCHECPLRNWCNYGKERLHG